MIRLALTDLDDTFIPFGAKKVSDRTISAIHRMLDAGLEFGPVTGRQPFAMSWMFGGDERCYATGAFANGQIVRIDGKTIKVISIPSDVLQRVADVLEDSGCPAWLAIYGDAPGKFAKLITRRADAVEANPPDTWGRSVYGTVPKVAPGGHVKANVQCSCSRPQMVELRDLLRREVPELSFVLPSLTARVIDVNVQGWDKGDGVRLLAKELGISQDEVAVFGDSENDLPMMRSVPNSVAVSNASDAVSAAARWHIGAAKDDAVAVALDQITELAESVRHELAFSTESPCLMVFPA
ncbi:MAG: Cof-type HAD-IIB family hydrolase [Olsenella sp.]|jgi:Cof subfamily protein (haloacid dehalogenase superfamily)|nr:Cof-type HAD-IIB family hydrolase [Olsenella sp.]MCI1289943.1 Cof-type HAD-IIB family hydrolase [Olsenella sp.]